MQVFPVANPCITRVDGPIAPYVFIAFAENFFLKRSE